MAKPFTSAEKFQLFLHRDGAQLGARVIIGGLIGALMPLGAWPVVAACAATSALYAYSQFAVEHFRKKVALGLYDEEVSAITGTPKEALNIEHLDAAADKGARVLQKTLDNFALRRNANIGIQVATSALMAAGLIALYSFSAVATLPVLAVAGSAAFVYNELFKAVDGVAHIALKLDSRRSISKSVYDIQDQVALGGRVPAARILSVFVEADPVMQKEIEARYGAPYDQLEIADKRRAVCEYEPRLHLAQLTRDVNRGNLRAPEIGFIAFGQRSGVRRLSDEEVTPPCTEGQEFSMEGPATSPRPSLQGGLFDNSTLPTVDDEFGSVREGYDRRALFHADRVKAQRLSNPFVERT